jgi:hypothetical protein
MTTSDAYKDTAINSFRLAVELFNRPYDEGRVESVLLFLNHSFEMLLKACILENGGQIRGKDGDGNTISFEKCVNKCRYGDQSGSEIIVLSESQGAALLAINNQRDFAEHEQVRIGEQQLYIQSRQAVEIFGELLKEVFEEDLADYIPDRILPLATRMPVDVVNVIKTDISTIQVLLSDGDVDEARRRVKSLDSLERGLEDNGQTPSRSELDDILDALDQDQDLEQVFPHIFAAITGDEDAGAGTRIQLGSEDGIPANYISQDDVDEDTDVHLFTEKNINDRFPLNPHQVRDRVEKKLDGEISWQKTNAVIKELGILDDDDYHREDISQGAGDSRDGYHGNVVNMVVDVINSDEVDPESAWDEHKSEIWSGQ